MPAKKKVSSPEVDHSPAILVALAYLIGFITAYIGFGINDGGYHHKNKSTPKDHAYQASVYSSVKAVTTDEGLFISDEDNQRIISAKSEKEDLSFGYHREIVSATVSVDGRYIYYCAEMDEVDSCHHFVYVKKEDKVYPVMKGGNALITDRRLAHSVVWLKDNTLQIDDLVSIDTTKPWLVE